MNLCLDKVMIVFELHIYYITLKFIFPYWVISHIQDRSVICYIYVYDSLYVHDKHPVKWKTILLWAEFFITVNGKKKEKETNWCISP